jgi:DNA-binding Lrp family transcriptional regulator
MAGLPQKEKAVIYAVQLQAESPVSRIRKITGYRDHTIRYFMQRALEHGVMRRRCFINLNVLGYTQYQIYFSLSSKEKGSRAGVIQTLIGSERVSWLGELGGEYQYGVNLCAKSIGQVWEFLDQLSARFGSIFFEKVLALRISLSYFGNKYLSTKKRPVKSLSYGVAQQTVALDEVDHKILCLLTRGGYDSWRHMARMLAMPQTTLDYRLKKLQQSGVVVGHYYEVPPSKIGMQSFILLVCVKGISREFKDAFYKFCEAHINVVVLIHSIGSWDFEVVVDVEEAQRITVVTQEIYDRFGASLNWIKILPSFGYPKVLEYPFQKYAP